MARTPDWRILSDHRDKLGECAQWNSATGEFNMIYRREDGNIGWVEPHAD